MLHRHALPQLNTGIFLTYTGMETDLLFTKGVDLPRFAAYPLLETSAGRDMVRQYYRDMIAVARDASLGVILESTTWVANRDRGALIGYSPETLKTRNQQAIALMVELRQQVGDLPTVISANIGPRLDAYAPAEQMTAHEAQQYHSEQITTLAATDLDIVSGYTIAYPAEAIGMVKAAQKNALPIVIAFTIETDGHLPTGMSVAEAIQTVDHATNNYTSYFMINCAHPDHVQTALTDAPWMQRLKGIVANASRCSHAELDNADTLDAGDPAELGQQLAEINRKFPQITILGGCCGTDMRHMREIARAGTRQS
ncbi:MAG: homocysteine S-methyltransferase family protein [Rhodobacteraceae bacterium]|nr:homocysteine S-methyltransferase family protein [Paracoccaceae bacterium]